MKKKYSSSEFFKMLAIGAVLLIGCNSSQAQSNSWPVPSDAVNVKNPEPSDEASIKNGKTLYHTYCAPCHGDKGKGDGPASASLNPKPADHTSAMVQAESDGTIYYKITEGRAHTAMPPFKAVLHPDQRWAIVNYMRTLGKNSK